MGKMVMMRRKNGLLMQCLLSEAHIEVRRKTCKRKVLTK